MGGGRLPELDGVRGVAILLVVVAHGGGLGLKHGGPVGVTLFFVLSGYLITGLLVREARETGRIDLQAFWARRARRILPALAPVILAVVVFYLFYDPSWRGVRVTALLPVANVVSGAGGDMTPFPHLWSLAVEEQFYLLWPLVLPLLLRGDPRRALAWTVVALTVTRTVVTVAGGAQWVYFSLDGNAYALALGAWAAVSGVALGRRWAVAGLVALVLLSVPLAGGDSHVFLAPVAAAAGVALILGCGGVRFLSWAPLRYAGVVSYGWYIWHGVLQAFYPESLVAVRWLGNVVGLGLAVLSWHLLERRFLRKSHSAEPVRAHVDI